MARGQLTYWRHISGWIRLSRRLASDRLLSVLQTLDPIMISEPTASTSNHHQRAACVRALVNALEPFTVHNSSQEQLTIEALTEHVRLARLALTKAREAPDERDAFSDVIRDLMAATEPFVRHSSSDPTIVITVKSQDVAQARAALMRASLAQKEAPESKAETDLRSRRAP